MKSVLLSAIAFLTLTLPVFGMQPPEVTAPSDTAPAIVRMWKNPDESTKDEHVSIETPEHYMSLHPVSEKVEYDKGYLSYNSPCFTSPSPAIDQLLQDRKLNGEDKIGSKGKPTTWPCETVTLHLKTKSMNKMWEELLEGSTPQDFDTTFSGKILKDVHYINEKMRKDFDRCIHNNRQPSEGSPLYFTNTSLVLGLLIKGGFFDKDIYFLKNSKYFGNELWSLPLPLILQNPGDTVKNNFYSRPDNPCVAYISGLFPEFSKRQELIRIHKQLAHDQIPTLPKARREVIIKMVDEKKSQAEIDKHLSDLKTIYDSQNSYVSGRGWVNTFFYKGEW